MAGGSSRVRFFKDPSLIPHPWANSPSEYSGNSIIKANGGSGGQFGGGKSIYGGGGGGGSGGSCIDQPTCNTLPGGRGGNGLNSDLTSDCHDDCGGSGGGGGSLNGAVGANGTDVQGISLSGVISNIRFPGTGLGIPRGAERRPMTPTNNVGYGGRAGIGPGAGAGGGSGGGNVGNHTGGSGGDGTDGAVIICWAGASGSFSHCPVTRSGVVWP